MSKEVALPLTVVYLQVTDLSLTSFPVTVITRMRKRKPLTSRTYLLVEELTVDLSSSCMDFLSDR